MIIIQLQGAFLKESEISKYRFFKLFYSNTIDVELFTMRNARLCNVLFDVTSCCWKSLCKMSSALFFRWNMFIHWGMNKKRYRCNCYCQQFKIVCYNWNHIVNTLTLSNALKPLLSTNTKRKCQQYYQHVNTTRCNCKCYCQQINTKRCNCNRYCQQVKTKRCNCNRYCQNIYTKRNRCNYYYQHVNIMH